MALISARDMKELWGISLSSNFHALRRAPKKPWQTDRTFPAPVAGKIRRDGKDKRFWELSEVQAWIEQQARMGGLK